MASLPSTEDTAHLILEAMVNDKMRAGDSLPRGAFRALVVKHGIDLRDVDGGVAFGVTKGWLKIGNQNSIALTDEGYKAAGTHEDALREVADHAQRVALLIQQGGHRVDQFQAAVPTGMSGPRDAALENVERALINVAATIDTYLRSLTLDRTRLP